MLAGVFFLLHTFVPHHHHADNASIIEHQHLVAHAMGLHDEEEEHKEHHHHHENTLDEITVVSATSQQQVNWHNILMPIFCGSVFLYDAEPAPFLIYNKVSAVQQTFLIQEFFYHTSLRGPPTYNRIS